MNFHDEIERIRLEGYSEANAASRLCQDIILHGIAAGSMSQNVTIKGGVVMRNLSRDARRATQDIDLDFIRFSISDESIQLFIDRINVIPGVSIELKLPIVELNHQDYKGKRIYIEICDDYDTVIESKIDIGVHKDLDIIQDEYAFDICFQENAVSLLMNSKEQIVTEKLKSFLRFGTRSTRYKDVFDICYLSDQVDVDRLMRCLNRYIFEDESLPVNSLDEMCTRIERVFTNNAFIRSIGRSRKNWLDISTEEVLRKDIAFVRSL